MLGVRRIRSENADVEWWRIVYPCPFERTLDGGLVSACLTTSKGVVLQVRVHELDGSGSDCYCNERTMYLSELMLPGDMPHART